jgi:hypothetical protein
MHAAIADAELAVIALDKALTIIVGLSGRLKCSASVPVRVREAQPLFKELRDHYSHVEERAFGRVKSEQTPHAEVAFDFDALVDHREFSNGVQALGLDAPATALCMAARDYLVETWLEMVTDIASTSDDYRTVAAVNWAAIDLAGGLFAPSLDARTPTCRTRADTDMWPGNEQIAAELSAIPKGSFGQNVFRSVFQNLRANGLGRRPEYPGATLEDTILRAISFVRANFPAFEAHIDWERLGALRSR